jgi:Dienelactone hydrolase family
MTGKPLSAPDRAGNHLHDQESRAMRFYQPRCLVVFLILVLSQCRAVLGQDAGLSREQAGETVERAWDELAESLKNGLSEELEANEIKAAGKSMKFAAREFGETPGVGRSLYISMHGGGHMPPRVNDQQWQNQIGLYEPEEGIYVAPRAPTDTWNLWHEAHIDPLFDRLILAFVVCRNVDPDRIYLMGYSAGGDGVYQLAPRMSDRWAAASMMAGHPNETRPDGLRNVPFALFMGGKDEAFNRNRIAAGWKEKLSELAAKDPGGYTHQVRIYQEAGHWMNRQDREALPWMSQYRRNCWPKRVVWVQDDVTHPRFYWLGVPGESARGGTVITAEVDSQTIVLTADVEHIRLYLNDELVDLDQRVSVQWNGKEAYAGIVKRSETAIRRSLQDRPDKPLAATAILEIQRPK